MKMKLTALIALFFSNFVHAQSIKFEAPKISTANTNAGQLHGNQKKMLRFDPSIELNPNRGTFKSVIKIPLPPNLLAIGSLNLIYHSNRPENLGMGYGWSWNLPHIFKNFKADSRKPYLTKGILGNLELTLTKQTPSKSMIAIIHDHFGKGKKFKIYRPLIDQSGTAFIKVFGAKNTFIGWISLSLNGTFWKFSKNGLPLWVADSKKNKILFEWKRGSLHSVRDFYASWKVKLSYFGKQNYRKDTAQDWQHLPIGLKTIRIGDRSIQFSYQDEYLLRAGWKDGIVPLFQGSYKFPSIKSIESLPIDLAKNDKNKVYRSTPFGEIEKIAEETDEKYFYMYTDINGDGRTDRVKFDITQAQTAIDKAFEETAEEWNKHAENYSEFRNTIRDRKDDGGPAYDLDSSSLQTRLNAMAANISFTVELRNSEAGNTNPEWTTDKSLSLSGLQPLRFLGSIRIEFNKVDDDEYEPVYKGEVKAIQNGLFFTDLNGDGRKDLIACPQTNYSATYHFVGKNPYSQNALYFMSKLQPSSVKGISFTDPTLFPSAKPRIFVQEPNHEEIDRKWSDGEYYEGSKPTTNLLLNTSRWNEITPQFKCNANSLFVDVNNDRRLDVITGNSAYLMGETLQRSHKTIVNFDAFIDHENSDKSFDLTDLGVSITDTNNDGKLELHQARSILKHPIYGYMELVKNKLIERRVLNHRVKLLSEFRSSFGGSVSLEFVFKGGVWVLSKKTSNPNTYLNATDTKQPINISTYDYQGSVRDAYLNVFTGFAKTLSHHHSQSPSGRVDQRIAPKTITRVYAKDVDPKTVLYAQRGRLNGYPIYQLVSDQKQNSGVKESLWKWRLTSLGDHRIWVSIAEKDVRLLDRGTKTFRARTKTLRQSLDWHREASKNDPIFPTQIKERREGVGLPSPYGDNLLDVIAVDIGTFKLIEKSNRRVIVKILHFGANGKLARPDEIINYDLKTGLPKSACAIDRCTYWKYDSLGRMIESKTSSGLIRTVNYPEYPTPLPNEISDIDGTEKRNYHHYSGRILSIENNMGGLLRWAYTPDGFIKTIHSGKVSEVENIKIYELDPTIAPCTLNDYCKTSRKINVEVEGIPYQYLLDGFGRIEASLQPFGNGVFRQGRKIYGPNHQVIVENRPNRSKVRDSGQPWKEFWKDPLGRNVRIVDFADESIIVQNRWGQCEEKILNGQIKSGKCNNSFGHLLTEWHGNERVAFETNDAGDLLGSPTLGIEWNVNVFGEVLSSQSEGGSFNGAIIWKPNSLKINHNERWIKTSKGSSKQLDTKGRISQFQRSDEYKETQTFENRQYTLGQMTHRSIQTGDSEGQTLLSETIETDHFGHPKRWSLGDYIIKTHYNHFGKITHQESIGPSTHQTFTYVYEDGLITQMKPIISDVNRYDSLGRIKEFNFENGVKIKRKYHHFSDKPEEVSLFSNEGELLLKQRLTWNRNYQIEDRITHFPGLETGLKAQALRKEVFEYQKGTLQLKLPSIVRTLQKNVQEDAEGRITQIDDYSIQWNEDTLASFMGYHFYYSAEGTLIATCPKNEIPSIKNPKCFYWLDSGRAIVEGKLIQLLRFDGMPVAVSIENKIYPILVDHLGSLIGLMDPSGEKLLWHRHFDEWGQKTVTYHSELNGEALEEVKFIEKAVIWNFAQLIVPPLPWKNGQQPLYWSKTRTYSSTHARWLSPDVRLLRKPKSLIKTPGNWFATRYSLNQPLTLIDPSGEQAMGEMAMFNEMLGLTRDQFWGEAVAATKVATKVAVTATVAAAVPMTIGAAVYAAPIVSAYMASGYLAAGVSYATYTAMVMQAIARYQAAAINFGLKIATNPALMTEMIGFADSFSSEMNGPTTGTLGGTGLGALLGTAAGYGTSKALKNIGTWENRFSLFSKEKAEAINNMSFSDALSTDLSSGFSDSSDTGRGEDGINSGDFSDSGNGEGGDSDGNNSGGFGGGGHGGIR